MHIVVIGAGVVGLISAWYLREAGHEVTVVDEQSGAAQGASHANGAQLSYDYVAPLAGPDVISKIPSWLFSPDPPLQFRPSWDASQWHWLMRFLLACNRTRSEQTLHALIGLASQSRELMHGFLKTGIGSNFQFCHRTNGKLVLYSDNSSFEEARKLVAFQQTLGSRQHVLSAGECRTLEPSLSPAASNLGKRMVGGILTPTEAVGDCYAFCKLLESALHARGVAFSYNCLIDAVNLKGSLINCLHATRSKVQGDAFVLAAGAGSARIGRMVGLYLPIAALKGYSLTLTCNNELPSRSITDHARKVVYARLDSGNTHQLRVAGLVDIVGNDVQIDPKRVDVLVRETSATFSGAVKSGALQLAVNAWAGMRPATPDGIPLYGKTRVSNLYLNTGHGALGWTLAHATAKRVADMVTHQT